MRLKLDWLPPRPALLTPREDEGEQAEAEAPSSSMLPSTAHGWLLGLLAGIILLDSLLNFPKE